MTVELINRIIQLFADYCGKLTEQDLRENYLLLYEVLDEVDDFGYPQDSSAEVLKNHVFNTSGSLWDTISPVFILYYIYIYMNRQEVPYLIYR